MRWLIVLMVVGSFSCNDSRPDKPASSSDSTIETIDPNGTIRDTSQYKIDTANSDSSASGLTH